MTWYEEESLETLNLQTQVPRASVEAQVQPLQESPECWPPGRTSRGHRMRLGAEVQEPECGPEMGWIPAEKQTPPTNTGRTTFSQAAKVMYGERRVLPTHSAQTN